VVIQYVILYQQQLALAEPSRMCALFYFFLFFCQMHLCVGHLISRLLEGGQTTWFAPAAAEEQEELERAGRFPTCETNMRVWVVVGRREGVGRTVDARAQPVSRRPAWATSTSDGGSRGGARQ